METKKSYSMPNILYKYRSWEATASDDHYGRKLLSEQEVYLSAPSQFNDPFDSALPARFRKEELTPENIYMMLRVTKKALHPELSDSEIEKLCYERQSSGVFESGIYVEESYKEIKELLELFGILSLSANECDILMWSHYANSHKGYCVGLDSQLLLSNTGGRLNKVTYSKLIPELEMRPDSLGNLIKLTNTKSEKWSYEEEFRIAVAGRARTVVKIPAEAVKEIILGCAMSEVSKSQVTELARSKFPHAQIFECKQSLDEFKLYLQPLAFNSPCT